MEVHIITGFVEGDTRSGASKNNKPFCAFTVRTMREFAGTPFTSYHSCMAWGESVKIAERLQSGDQVQVLSNEARAEVYTPTNGKYAGQPRGKVTYTVREIELLNTSKADDASKPGPKEEPKRADPKPQPAPDDDVPF